MKIKFIVALLLVSLSIFILPTNLPIKKIIIWGHKLHSHTHSYVHWGFYRAFRHLKFETYWFDNNDKLNNFDFSNSLFITEWQVDEKMPIRDDCFYIVHNMYLLIPGQEHDKSKKYKHLWEKGQVINLLVYLDDYKNNPNLQKMEDYVYYDLDHRTIYMPWATDLLPDEIETIKKNILFRKKTNNIFWIGTMGGGWAGNINQINPFITACKENGIHFQHKINLNMEENISLIQQSYMAPAIQGIWQLQHGYIPCRIFKNISYGQFGITNSKTVYELFDRKIIYNSDTKQLFYDAKKKLEKLNIQELYDLMDFVKTKHTYLNRISCLLNFFEILN